MRPFNEYALYRATINALYGLIWAAIDAAYEEVGLGAELVEWEFFSDGRWTEPPFDARVAGGWPWGHWNFTPEREAPPRSGRVQGARSTTKETHVGLQGSRIDPGAPDERNHP